MTERRHERADRPENAILERLFESGEQATRSIAPMMTGAARMNMELASLAGRRAQAYLELPSAVAQCRGPQDVFAAQMRFWQTALEDYSTCNRRIVAALSATNAVTSAGGSDGTQRKERDTLTFPDVFSFTPWALPENGQRRRDPEERAA
jgi:hypothetical protein